jgi:uncharacterized integral membrane protein
MQLLHAARKFGLPLILGIGIGAGLVIFAMQNTAIATIGFMSWHYSLSLALLVTGAIALGALATIIAMVPGFIKNERYIRELKAEKKAAEDELSKYRIIIPIAPPEQQLNQQVPVYVRPMPNQQR